MKTNSHKLLIALILSGGIVACNSGASTTNAVRINQSAKLKGNYVVKCSGPGYAVGAKFTAPDSGGIKREYLVVDNSTIKDHLDDDVYICTSHVTDMSGLFQERNIPKKLDTWDTSNVTNMSDMFRSSFGYTLKTLCQTSLPPLLNMDTSKITDMSGMFSGQNNFTPECENAVSNLNVSNVKNMAYMFRGSNFNGQLNHWDTHNVTNMRAMFQCISSVGIETCKFNQPIGNWDTHNVTDMSEMFADMTFSEFNPFNQDISRWDTSSVKNMSKMFSISKFNNDISKWDTHNVTNMNGMFAYNQEFSQDIHQWNVTNVTNFQNFRNDTYGYTSRLYDFMVPYDFISNNIQQLPITVSVNGGEKAFHVFSYIDISKNNLETAMKPGESYGAPLQSDVVITIHDTAYGFEKGRLIIGVNCVIKENRFPAGQYEVTHDPRVGCKIVQNWAG